VNCGDACRLDRRCELYRDCEAGCPPLWDILITSIPHRHALLCGLLAELDRQRAELLGPGAIGRMGAIVYRDNLELPYGDKTGVLMRASRAQYVSCIDDDDLPGPGYLAWIWSALAGRPDFVGYPVRWTRDGQEQIPVSHSLRHGCWGAAGDGQLIRDLSEKNPIRRELALLGPWSGGYEAERRWAEAVRATGRVRTEVWVPEPLYWYRESSADTFKTGRQPLPGPLPELPSYPWLAVLGH
jgi:hypothetical protein